MMSFNYGLSPKDLQDCKDKLKKQKDYMLSNTFLNEDTGEIKSMLDFSYSANLSTRYYPRILNKVHTFVSLNTAKNYTPIFLTITLDGFFRDFLKGDFSRWEKNRDNYIKHIPNNDRSGYYLDYIDEHKQLTTKDLYKILGHQIHRFNQCITFRNIKDAGHKHSYIRVTEPHKDGTPHFHILLYVPDDYVKDVYREFKRFFPAPQNHKPLKHREASIIFDDVKETLGFQTEIRAAGGYILKYILKSFRNLLEEKELDYLQAWYVHNKVPRIITTHTLISQDVYHHASLLEDDWFYLTDIKLNAYFERNTMMNTFYFKSDNEREIIYKNGYYKLVSHGITVKEFGENKFFGYRFTVDCPIKYPYVPNIPTSLTDRFWLFRKRRRYIYKIEEVRASLYMPKRNDYINNIISSSGIVEVTVNDITDIETFFFDSETNKKLTISDYLPVDTLTYSELIDLYNNFDFDKFNPKKYALVKNRLIELNLIDDDYVNLNDFNYDFC